MSGAGVALLGDIWQQFAMRICVIGDIGDMRYLSALIVFALLTPSAALAQSPVSGTGQATGYLSNLISRMDQTADTVLHAQRANPNSYKSGVKDGDADLAAGKLHLLEEDITTAKSDFLRAMSKYTGVFTDDKEGIAQAKVLLADVELLLGNLSEAEKQYKDVLTSSYCNGSGRDVCKRAEAGAGDVFLLGKHFVGASKRYTKALEGCDEFFDSNCDTRALVGMARLELAYGNSKKSIDYCTRAIKNLNYRDELDQSKTLLDCAEIELASGSPGLAKQHYMQAASLLEGQSSHASRKALYFANRISDKAANTRKEHKPPEGQTKPPEGQTKPPEAVSVQHSNFADNVYTYLKDISDKWGSLLTFIATVMVIIGGLYTTWRWFVGKS